MVKDLKYFMRKQETEIIEVPGPKTITDDEGNPVMLQIKVLSIKEIDKIKNNYRRRSVALDKNGSPYIANGEVIFKTETDNEKISGHIIAEALVYPNLKDPELMKFYNCHDISEMAELVFSSAKEYKCVSDAVMKILSKNDDDDEDLEKAKN